MVTALYYPESYAIIQNRRMSLGGFGKVGVISVDTASLKKNRQRNLF